MIGRGTLDSVELLGYDAIAHVRLGGDLLTARASPATLPPIGAPVGLYAAADRVHVFDRATGMAIQAERIVNVPPQP
jgi:ABC-type sugar transport system ATPase subunit